MDAESDVNTGSKERTGANMGNGQNVHKKKFHAGDGSPGMETDLEMDVEGVRESTTRVERGSNSRAAGYDVPRKGAAKPAGN